MPQAATDLSGQTFGRLTAIARHPCKGIVRWDCKCSCGATTVVPSVALKNGYTRSCGCLRRETAKARAQARARRGGQERAWRQAPPPATARADDPPKTWAGTGDAIADLNAIWNRSFVCQTTPRKVFGGEENK